jgi:light-regulated signal transduction histidine kinase (bacteriophytochrome)
VRATVSGFRNLSPAIRDLVVIGILSIGIYVLSSQFDLFEKLATFVTTYENLQMDEAVTVGLFLVVALAVFSYRRWKELGTEYAETLRAREALAQSNRHLNILTAITRHDLANQLFIVQAYTRYAMKKDPDPVIAGYLAKIDAAANNMVRQIGFTKKYQDLGANAPAWHRIGDLVSTEHPSGIHVTCTCDAIEIYADPMIGKVFFNIFDNAVRHGKTVTRILVGCTQVAEVLVVTVDDDGNGIPPDEKEKIFENGYGQNTGFGLFLAREILAITGISMTETGVPGNGARFELRVPKGMYRRTGAA